MKEPVERSDAVHPHLIMQRLFERLPPERVHELIEMVKGQEGTYIHPHESIPEDMPELLRCHLISLQWATREKRCLVQQLRERLEDYVHGKRIQKEQ